MATSVRAHRACPKYFIDLPPRPLITPKIIRTVEPQCSAMPSSDQKTSCSIDGDCASKGETGNGAAKGGKQSQTISQFAANMIVPELWLGSHADSFCAEELRQHNIYNVLNVALECITPDTLTADQQNDAKTPIRVKHVMLEDHSDEDISRHFEECSEFIHDSIVNRGQGVLVHCRMGVSRSATIVIAYLMEHGKRYHQQVTELHTWNLLRSPLPGSEQPDIFSNFHDIPTTSCGVTPSTSTSTSASSSPDIVSHEWLSYNDAFDLVKSARPEISPNLGFCIALRELDVRHGNRKDEAWEDVAFNK